MDDERLQVAIRAAHRKTREPYGAKRLPTELRAAGFAAGRGRIARLRPERGIVCKQKREFKAPTQSNHDLPVAETLVGQCLEATAPNEVWHPDSAYLHTGEGWLYLAGSKDQFTRESVGYAMGARMTQELIGQALWRAILYQRPEPGLIHYSDSKNEPVPHQRYETRADAEASIRECLEIFYTRQRRHSRLGKVTPAVFAQNFRKQQQAA